MSLVKVLSRVNQIEKKSFLKIFDKYYGECRSNSPKIDQILAEGSNILKKAEDTSIAHFVDLIRDGFLCYDSKMKFSNIQLDAIVEIFVRDGNQNMSKDWFFKLYKKELQSLKQQIKRVNLEIKKESAGLPLEKKKDYQIYQACVKTAYVNEREQNRSGYFLSRVYRFAYFGSPAGDISRRRTGKPIWGCSPGEARCGRYHCRIKRSRGCFA